MNAVVGLGCALLFAVIAYVEPQEPPLKPCDTRCKLGCIYGFQTDQNGCKICKCRDPPVITKCPRGSKLVLPRKTCPLWRQFEANLGYQYCGNDAFCHVTKGTRGVCCERRRIIPIGKCPPVPKTTILCKRIVNQCRSNNDCKRGRRCCPDICGRVCVLTGSSFPPLKLPF